MKILFRFIIYIGFFLISSYSIAGIIEDTSIQESRERVISYESTGNTTFYKTMAYDIRNQMLIDGQNYKDNEVKKISSGVNVNSNYVNAASGSTVVVIQNNSGNTVAVGK